MLIFPAISFVGFHICNKTASSSTKGADKEGQCDWCWHIMHFLTSLYLVLAIQSLNMVQAIK
jgi:hypothetical protein